MKRAIPTLILFVFIMSCAPANFPIGTSEDVFIKKLKGARLVESSINGTIYIYEPYFTTSGPTKYYYFSNGKLIKIDGGVYETPRIRIDNYNH